MVHQVPPDFIVLRPGRHVARDLPAVYWLEGRERDGTLDRSVAIKVLPAAVCDAGARERFLREARAAADRSLLRSSKSGNAAVGGSTTHSAQ